MKAILRGLTFAAAAFAVSACSDLEKVVSVSEVKTVQGSVSYRERIALPPSAQLVVSLEDTSAKGAKSTVITTQTINTSDKPMPYTFMLEAPVKDIVEANSYTVSAYIEAQGEKLFVTDSALPVLTNPEKTTDVKIVLTQVQK